MGKYNVHAGHCPQGKGAYGAVGLMQESVENRKVKDRLIQDMKNGGHTVYDCTDDTNCAESQNLQRIVAKCNAHSVDLDVSIHLNSGRNDYPGDGSTGGVEVWITNDAVYCVAEKVCKEVSAALGIRNRGVKLTDVLYVLNHTVAKAMLVECCFVDDKDDADRWNANKCADAIYKGITGANTSGNAPVSKPEKPIVTKDALVKQSQTHMNNVLHQNGSLGGEIAEDGIAGPDTKKSRIMLFQYCHNLDTKDSILVDGIMGPETDAAMKNTKLQKGYVGYLASFVEIALMSWGYDPKGVEWAGEIGDGCNNAGMQFQKDRGYYGGKEVIFGYTTIKDLLS